MTGLAQAALRDGVQEMTRAEGRRGKLVLCAELRLGDGGEPTSMVSSLFFEQFRHNKDARERRNDEA